MSKTVHLRYKRNETEKVNMFQFKYLKQNLKLCEQKNN